MITPQEALTRVIEHREIFHDEMLEIMRQIKRVFRCSLGYDFRRVVLRIFDVIFFHGALIARRPPGRP